ncbi:hypothetical protein HaLaN_20403, partial [Haematococcus lacustris]
MDGWWRELEPGQQHWVWTTLGEPRAYAGVRPEVAQLARGWVGDFGKLQPQPQPQGAQVTESSCPEPHNIPSPMLGLVGRRQPQPDDDPEAAALRAEVASSFTSFGSGSSLGDEELLQQSILQLTNMLSDSDSDLDLTINSAGGEGWAGEQGRGKLVGPAHVSAGLGSAVTLRGLGTSFLAAAGQVKAVSPR